MNTHDTIVAPATAIGGAVTIIRISGQKPLKF
jgi:tRNA U34 5-carboxymethylaminomethyl modifying GTPase MnmE/TrmE